MKLIRLLEIERKDMPQVRGKDTADALHDLADNGIAYRKGKVAVNVLKPTQEDGIPSKVGAIASRLTQGETIPPIWISMDGWILDGHHRWLAVKKVYGNEEPMDVIMIMLKKLSALRMFDKTADEVNDEPNGM